MKAIVFNKIGVAILLSTALISQGHAMEDLNEWGGQQEDSPPHFKNHVSEKKENSISQNEVSAPMSPKKYPPHSFDHLTTSIEITEAKPVEINEAIEASVSVFPEELPFVMILEIMSYLKSKDYCSLSQVTKGCAQHVNKVLGYYMRNNHVASRFFQNENPSKWQLKEMYLLDTKQMVNNTFAYIQKKPCNNKGVENIIAAEEKIFVEKKDRRNKNFVESQVHKKIKLLFDKPKIPIDIILKTINFLPSSYIMDLKKKNETAPFIQKLIKSIIQLQSQPYTPENSEAAFKFIDCLMLLSLEETETMLTNIPVAIEYGMKVIENEKKPEILNSVYERLFTYFDKLIEWTHKDKEYKENFSWAVNFYTKALNYYIKENNIKLIEFCRSKLSDLQNVIDQMNIFNP